MAAKRECAVEGCGGPHRALGLCGKHYDRQRTRTPEQRAARLASMAAWHRKQRAESPEYVLNMRSTAAAWYAQRRLDPLYREQGAERTRAWRAAHPDQVRADKRRDRVRRYVARQADDVALALALRHDPCAYCGAAGGTLDHIVPIAGGGRNSIDNLAGACRSCNSSKRDTPLLHFLLGRRG